jgi:hypothetical protein
VRLEEFSFSGYGEWLLLGNNSADVTVDGFHIASSDGGSIFDADHARRLPTLQMSGICVRLR